MREMRNIADWGKKKLYINHCDQMTLHLRTLLIDSLSKDTTFQSVMALYTKITQQLDNIQTDLCEFKPHISYLRYLDMIGPKTL